MRTKDDLRQLQALPLELKIGLTKRRIADWVNYYGESGVYVSFSGGKDSTVLLHMVREMFPNVEAVFVNTGLEYPEIQQFVKSFDNVTILRPKMRFDEVIKTYGYPIISKHVSGMVEYARANIAEKKYSLRLAQLGVKETEYGGLQNVEGYDYKSKVERSKFAAKKYRHLLEVDFRVSNKCCDIMKKRPTKEYEERTNKKPMLAVMASESIQRESDWLALGCNAFDSKRPKSQPMAFWTEQDVLLYIKKYNIPIASVYGEVVYKTEPEQLRVEEYGIDGCGTEPLCTTGCDRTGCIFCAYGAHIKQVNDFERTKQTHPRQHAFCIGGGEYDENGMWQPNKQGLGMGHVFDELNKIYGDDFIKY